MGHRAKDDARLAIDGRLADAAFGAVPVSSISTASATNTQTAPAALLSALAFAASKHSGGVRRNSLPYINHPIAVAELLANVAQVSDAAVLQAAVLHDVLEDTPTPTSDLTERFGELVCSIVQEVTDDMSLPRERRKQLQIDSAPHLSPAAKLIRIADKIANIREITPTEPADWPLERKREYLDWAEQVARCCRGCNTGLDHHFALILGNQRAALAEG